MKAVIVANARAQHQKSWGGAFRAGLERHGITAEIREQPGPCDLLVLWGVRARGAIRQQKDAGGEVCILERGYLGDRFRWTSVSFGGRLNGRATFRGVSTAPERFRTHFGGMIKPWRDGGESALLIGQVPGDMSLEGAGIDQWYADMNARLQAAGHVVKFRPHPVATSRGFCPPTLPGAEVIEGALDAALARAALVVTYNSNTGVDAVLAGVPTVAMDEGSMAWEVTGHQPEDALRPARMEWANKLAWKQWSLEEMTSGECWARVGG